MKDGNVEDTRNLLLADDAANECVPQGHNGWTMQFSNFHPAILSTLRTIRTLRSTSMVYLVPRSFTLYHPQPEQS